MPKQKLAISVLFLSLLGVGVAAQQKDEGAPADRRGPLVQIKPEESDLTLDSPQFKSASATFYRQEINGERVLRDLAIYRGVGEIAYVQFDSADPKQIGSMASGEGPEVAVEDLAELLPKGAKIAWGETKEYSSSARSYPTIRFRMSFTNSGADCVSFLRIYDPRPGRSTASKRLSGVYCSIVAPLNDAGITAFFEGIRTRY
jgi:hypothetical protein